MIDPKKIAEWRELLAIAQRPVEDDFLKALERGRQIGVLACEAVPALLSERDELIALLREVEWAAVAGYRCPICHGRRPGTLSHYDLQDPGLDRSEGHAPDCRLGAFLPMPASVPAQGTKAPEER
jgi:hypothetical protein